ncbi:MULTISPECIES: 16S rRNA (cytosine(967)-C(5))-methyltransferase RsmB [Thermoactinomyces]|uniref:16S rRNA (cytosine(967)-C(5))-methyltransferase RsmB n=1 Tax=Thermoactinomyces TaxID=2023 RepID=UPI0005041D8F|nr:MULTISPECIES: 16S rRNA (cytosine(967)-C(5))-methyltransferase RsmB [Thermoactinomyces]MBH8582776.1 16S rRNA (cytosine(967)-C(5))-methyltransferase RsmB [Thermoactinomyces sp. CICC 10735]MBI0386936.1 16S rRNA (cytosine(967)-C(5))-methyltransferase RsmB [Thermoactinomyces sp. CICC 24227]MBI0391709.1 16S rRNA (cytosine(967)-C(5))-methyltransferase RsmB [Thermoactinomyces sp. CICC 24226]KFZ40605.1 16S rRNA methyltransferase [Thermoactinomyces sp. Gus2-1]KYQ86993.1 16S rRNA methyltransferase [Th
MTKQREVNARETALSILEKWEERQAYSNLLLNQALQASPLNEKDKRLVTELVYGTIQRKNTLDWILNQLVKKGVGSLELWVRQLLRLGIYQLLYLDKIPERAAIYETVQISKKRGHRGISGLVNGVLRSFLRNRHRLTPKKNPQTLAEKAVSYSHPEWIIERMEQAYGEEETKAALLSNHHPPRVSVRVNRLKMDPDVFIKEWNATGTGQAEASGIAPEGVTISGGGNPAFTPWFREGYCTIQDESSMLVARVLAPAPGMKVLDVCAAPGGKTTHLAELMGNQGHIVACDVHDHKLSLIRSNASRLGIDIISVRQLDGRNLPGPFQPHTFDAILLDAPCSGLGVIRRKPDLKWGKEAENIEALAQLQKELLDAAAPLLKPGGVLVYSTCTWESRENWEQVESFLKRHPDFSGDNTWKEKLPDPLKNRVHSGDGWIQILPHDFLSDGFFISRMIKH